MTEETFKKALKLNSQIQELNYRINRKMEEIALFKAKYNPTDNIQFFDFYEGSIELTYKEALNKMTERLDIDQKTLEMVQIQFNNL